MDQLKMRSLDLGLFWLRLVVGLSMASHGYGKVFGGNMNQFAEGVAAMGFPLPIVFAWAAALSELVGGVCVALGLWTKPAAFLVCLTMAVAAFLKHADDPFKKKELALVYWAVFGALSGFGAGKYSLDHWIQNRRKK